MIAHGRKADWARQRVGADTTQNAAGGSACGSGRVRRRCDEEQIQAALVLHLTVRAVPGVVFFAVPNGGVRSRTEAARMKATGTKAGAPDLVIVRGGHFYGLELKAERGRVSDAQTAMLADLETAGATVAITYGLDEALATLTRWGLLREARGAGGGPSGAVPRIAAAAG